MNFKEELAARTAGVETIIKKYLPAEEGYQRTVLEAMNYSVCAGGKRLRPLLMQETYRMFGGDGEIVEPFMAALEMLHTYSLVHDDLPAMDNDDYRRGRRTTHKVYGEAMGILAGDALLNYAFETAIKAFFMGGDAMRVARALEIFAGKAGIYGMIGGQSADVEAEGKPVQGELLDFIFRLKTGALLESAMMTGAVLAGADKEEVEAIGRVALSVGIAFQIQDDILDVTGTMEELGKPIGSDEKNEKCTYVTLHGLDAAKEEVRRLTDEAVSKLRTLPGEHDFLERLLRSLVERTK